MNGNSSTVVSKEQCPRCARQGRDKAHDNLAVYSDGHKYCFACGYHKGSPNSIQRMRETLRRDARLQPKLEYNFEYDNITTHLPAPCRRWLDRYGITQQEIMDHRLFYDNDRELLILPVYDADRLVVTNGRYFGSNPKHPKYLTVGYKGHHFKVVSPVTPTDVWVLTEDYLSALKVGRVANAIPLLGATVPDKLIFSLISRRPTLRVWLDFDKANEATKITRRVSQFIQNCGTIVSQLDPKAYDTDQIKTFILDTLPRPTESIPTA